MANQLEREKITQRIDYLLLEEINKLCNSEGFVRNKLIERYIREGYINDLMKRRRMKDLEEFYNKEKQNKLLSLNKNNQELKNVSKL